MQKCEHLIKYQYRFTEDKPIPVLEVRARCSLCGHAGEWFRVKADRVDHEIKKKRAAENFQCWSEKGGDHE